MRSTIYTPINTCETIAALQRLALRLVHVMVLSMKPQARGLRGGSAGANMKACKLRAREMTSMGDASS
eukprot:6214527-Pleurochrysis_carterae.AAC.1